MTPLFDLITQMSGGDNSATMVSVFVFLSAGALAFGIMAVIQVRVAVKRRTAGIGTVAFVNPDGTRSAIVVNEWGSARSVTVRDGSTAITTVVPAGSLLTLRWP